MVVGRTARRVSGSRSSHTNPRDSASRPLATRRAPLLLFALAERKLSLTTLGLLQYLSPTIQFLLGIWLFQEPFSATRFVGFALIWIALALYTLDGWRRRGLAVAPQPSSS